VHQLTILHLRNDPIDQCLYLLFHCPNLIEFHSLIPAVNIHTIFPPEVIFSPSRTPKICLNSEISEFFIGEASTRMGINFCSPRFDFLTLRSGECLVPVYDCFGRQNISTAYRQNLLTKSIDSILVNEFIPSLSRITALDWDIPLPSYSCLCFNDVFSRTNLSSLQQLYIEVDHFTKPFLGSKH